MSILRVGTIEPEGATTTLTLGASGDTVTSSADSINANTFKDAGGNTLWTSNGSGTLSSINSGLKPSGPVLISTNTITSAVTESTFTTGIDSTYDIYMFAFINMEIDYNGSQIVFQCSTDGGSSWGITKTTTVFLTYHNEANTTQSLTYQANQDLAQSNAAQSISYQQGGNAPADESLCGIMYLYGPASTTYVKQFMVTTQFYVATDQSWSWWGAGYFNTTSAIDAIKFDSVQGDIVKGTIAMYGIA